MRRLLLTIAATTLLAGPALAAGKSADAPGQQPKVCLLTFDGTFGADADVVKAQYLPLQAAKHVKRDAATQGIAYYGFGALSAVQQAMIDFYYPDGSSSAVIGVNATSDTATLCEAFKAYADSQDDSDETD